MKPLFDIIIFKYPYYEDGIPGRIEWKYDKNWEIIYPVFYEDVPYYAIKGQQLTLNL